LLHENQDSIWNGKIMVDWDEQDEEQQGRNRKAWVWVSSRRAPPRFKKRHSIMVEWLQLDH
jgi:hypothetical protein